MRPSFGLFALVTALFTGGFEAYLRTQPGSDLDSHIAYADKIHGLSDITSPHFLFELAIKTVHAAGLAYIDASAILLGLCYGGMAVLLARELQRREARLGTARLYLVVLATLLASHVFLVTASERNWYFGYFVPTAYHNPTQQPNKLFGLWIYFLYCSLVIGERRLQPSNAEPIDQRQRGTGLLLAALCVLSALTKPSFLLAFLPSAGVYALRDAIRRHWRTVARFAAAVAIPSGLVLLWQARIALTGPGGSPVVFAPFVIFDFWQTLYKLPASLGFTLLVGIAAVRQRLVDDRLRFAWLYAAIALFLTLFVVEQGHRMMHGNFAWTGQTGVFLLYVESVLFLLTRPLAPRWRRAAWGMFAVHVGCGIAWFGLQFAPHGTRFW